MQQLFEKEQEIMDIIWEKGEPCLISEILRADAALSRNTVAKGLVTLEKKGFLRVDGVKKTVTRSGRTYAPTITKKEYNTQMELMKFISESRSLTETAEKLIEAICKSEEYDPNFLDALENKILQYKDHR